MGKVDTLWIITRPTKDSTLADILFECDIDGLQRQFDGGLTANEILGVYVKQKEAEAVAIETLQERDSMGAKLTGTIEVEFSLSLEFFTDKKAAEEHMLCLIADACTQEWQAAWVRPKTATFKPVYGVDS